jgi:hypothetical protein
MKSGYCAAHRLDMRELGRRGGRRSRDKKRPEQTSDRLEEPAHQALEELLTSSGNATARQQAARLVLDRLAPNSDFRCGARAPRCVGGDSRADEGALPAAGAKLERLIESRARTLAEQMHEEQKRLDLEAVKAEMTDT